MRAVLAILVLAVFYVGTAYTQESTPIQLDLQELSLGSLKPQIQPVFTEISLANTGLNAQMSKADVLTTVAESVSGVSQGVLGDIIQFSAAAILAKDVVAARDLEEVASSLSLLDLSGVSTGLGDFSSQIGQLSADLRSIEPLPNVSQLWLAASLISNSARSQMTSLQQFSYDRINLLTASGLQVNKALEELGKLESSIVTAERASHALAEHVYPYPIFGESLAAAFAGTEGDLVLLRTGTLSSVRARLSNTLPIIQSKIDEDIRVAEAVESILNHPQLSSVWLSTFSSESNNSFAVSGAEVGFNHPTIEIDGPFRVARLSITNNVCLEDCRSGVTLSGLVIRTVDIPGFEVPVTTEANISLPMSYFATKNTDDPVESQDYFEISAINKRAHIRERGTEVFDVWARYDSPLRIVDVTLSDDATGDGFITYQNVRTEMLQVNPVGTYLVSESSTQYAPIDLARFPEIDLTKPLRIERLGGFAGSTKEADDSRHSLVGVFSVTDEFVPDAAGRRLPTAIDAGIDFVTSVGDIPEDFLISADIGLPRFAIIDVPAGARYLFLSVDESSYLDNSDFDGDFRILIGNVPVPESSIGCVGLIGTILAASCRRRSAV